MDLLGVSHAALNDFGRSFDHFFDNSRENIKVVVREFDSEHRFTATSEASMKWKLVNFVIKMAWSGIGFG